MYFKHQHKKGSMSHHVTVIRDNYNYFINKYGYTALYVNLLILPLIQFTVKIWKLQLSANCYNYPTVNFLTILTPKKFVVITKIWTMWLYLRVMSPNEADGMANSVAPDQTAPLGAVWSGSALFAQAYLSENLGSLRYTLSWKVRDILACVISVNPSKLLI